MGKKKEYKEANRRFLKNLSFQEGVFALPCGIYYKILETGEGTCLLYTSDAADD